MAGAAQRIDPVTLDEFQAMRFGDRKAELIDGVIVVAQAFPSSRHGQIAAAMTAHFFGAIRAGKLPCRTETGTGVEIRLERDYNLGPDVLVRCGTDRSAPGQPVLVVEVLSPSNSATELMKKLHAYQAVDSLTDILLVEQDAYAVEHWTRTQGGAWTLAPRLSGADAVLALPRFAAEWRLDDLYGDA
jgi:Uma2 family endonuclease